ncbi:hypothetical protein Cob_v005471 [Colletotrichum orbiculare MAFF 240422]|uniref:Uncharacterized protein n=1 Tax=Colletotrichum orbiculare (strain 104-T / ATCC 96160 / CBS 514.97 / LARS 414 / MAFF 240422) TaxID=1213857 RepID=A0A484FUG4_COLOR|nr:hypothetical protein Cob_v005471 [Colletotrichum orbiculare MAFF 240422]
MLAQSQQASLSSDPAADHNIVSVQQPPLTRDVVEAPSATSVAYPHFRHPSRCTASIRPVSSLIHATQPKLDKVFHLQTSTVPLNDFQHHCQHQGRPPPKDPSRTLIQPLARPLPLRRAFHPVAGLSLNPTVPQNHPGTHYKTTTVTTKFFAKTNSTSGIAVAKNILATANGGDYHTASSQTAQRSSLFE